MGLGRLWAGWRMPYVTEATTDIAASPGDPDLPEYCVFCRILSADRPDEETFVVWRGPTTALILNAYPYASGHLLAMPRRHVGDPEELTAEESQALWSTTWAGVAALRRAYQPDGVNVGANLGRAAGAGIPGHLHFHALPRWVGDTNFLTTVAEARVLPEALPVTWTRLREEFSPPG